MSSTEPSQSGAAGAAPPVVLVDGSGYIFRAYHALPPLTRKSDGLPTGAVFGFCNMLQKLMTELEAAGGAGHLAVLFDAGRKTFRNDLYPEYKAHRPPPPEDLVPQFALIREAVARFNVPAIERDGFEADDLIASYARAARTAGYPVIIVSSDKDLMQLVGDGVRMRDPLKDRLIGEDEVREKFGVGPDRVVDVQALAGDATDNVPGVPGIGVKTAAMLLQTYGDLDTLLDRAGEIKQPKRRQTLLDNADLARVSRELVRLKDDVPLDSDIESLTLHPPDPNTLLPWLEEMEFGNLTRRMRARWGGEDAPVPAPAAASVAAPSGAAEYSCLRTRAELDRVVAEAITVGRVALHLEADGDDEMTAALTGAALATAPGRAWVVAVAGTPQQSLDLADAPAPRDGLAVADLVAALKPLAEDRGTLKVAHDAKRAVKLLARAGVTLTPVDDTLLLSFVLGGGHDDHGLGPVAARMADFDAPDRKKLLGSGKSAVPFAAAAEDVAIALACGSADAVLRAHAALRAALLRERLVAVFETIERPLIPVLAEMERTGVRIDPEALAELSATFAERMQSAEQEAHRLAGREFNVASPKQLGEVLFDEMGLPGGRKTRTGAWSTDADALDMLAADGHTLPAAILDWRQVAKLRSTYTETLARDINPVTGRVHTTYGMAGAATGRLASMNPNLQNIPVRTEDGRRIRRAFVADRGHVLVSADYSQIELRLLAQLAGIDSLAAAFRDGIDIHALTASEVFGVAIDGMDPETRRRAKAINFGIIYGISPFGLARQLGIPQSAAKEYIAAYFERYPGIRAYMDRAKDYARRHGYVITWSGRRIHIPGIADKNHAHRAFSERAAINAPLQGSAADIMKRALVRMHRALDRAKLPARMLLSVHDEILFEVRESAAQDLRALAKREMEAAAQLDVPLTVETGAGPNWDEAH